MRHSSSWRGELTVVIPVWGRQYVEDFLPRAIASVPQGVRVVVIDNASDVPLPPLSHEPEVTVERLSERVSLGRARNAALSHVRTPWVIFLDADDQLIDEGVDLMLELAIGRQGTVAVSAVLVDPVDGERYHWPYRWMRRCTRWPRIFAVLETTRPSFPVNGSLLATGAVTAAGGYDPCPAAAEDWTLGVSLSWRGRVLVPDVPTMTYASRSAGVWARSQRLRHHLAHRRAVRNRVREDAAVPSAVRALLPALLLVHVVDALRKVTRPTLHGVLTSWRGTSRRPST